MFMLRVSPVQNESPRHRGGIRGRTPKDARRSARHPVLSGLELNPSLSIATVSNSATRWILYAAMPINSEEELAGRQGSLFAASIDLLAYTIFTRDQPHPDV